MNIIIISYIYPKKENPSQGIFIHALARYMVKEGNSVEIITTRSYGDKKFETWDNVKSHRVASINHPKGIAGLLFIIGTIVALLRLSRKKKVDLVLGGFLGSSTIVAGLLLKLINLKFIVISWGTKWELPKKSWFHNMLIRLAASFPEKIICNSKRTKELLSQNIDKNKLHVIISGMDSEYLTPSKTAAEFRKQTKVGNKKVVLTVSNLVHKKGIDVIIRAIGNVSKKYPNMIHLIVGDGYDRQKFENMVKKLNLSKYIRFEGNLNHISYRQRGKELANYYNMCDIFVLMSSDSKGEIESLGIVYLEASYFGKPVIGGISGGTGDAVEHGKIGYLIDSKDQNALERKLLLLLKDGKLRKKLGNAGRKRIIDEFLWENKIKEILEFCKVK